MIHSEREPLLPQLKEMPRFFPDGAPNTVAGVFATPLEMPYQSFKIRGKRAGMPFDGMLTRADELYDDAALLYMDHTMDHLRLKWSVPIKSADEGKGWYDANKQRLPNSTWLSAMHEFRIQHELKLRRNDRATAPFKFNMKVVTPEEAEELMQIRGGIASLPGMLRFLSQYQEAGGVEIMKATVPFDPVDAMHARHELMLGLAAVNDPDIFVAFPHSQPKRVHIKAGVDKEEELHDKPDPRIMVFKTLIAKVAVRCANGRFFWEDVIRRDSGVILDELHGDDMKNSYYKLTNDDGLIQHAAPITITAYTCPSKVAPEALVE